MAAKSSSGEMAVYLFFDNNSLDEKSGHTLFKIDLPPMMHSIIKNSKSSSSSSSKLLLLPPPPISINPILELPWGEYPHWMSCAQLGSKFYLFGGFNNKPLPSPLRIDTCKLQHLGGGYFILLSASPALLNDGIPKPNTREVRINIVKEVLPTAGGGSTQVDTASSSFNAKIVFSQNYVCKTEFGHGGKFLSCFLGPKPCPNWTCQQVIEDHEPFEGEALFRDVTAKNDRSS